jgi:hypothetical protein
MAVPLFSLSALSQTAATSCKVIDPELQGYHAGGCVNGLAEGRGEAAGTAQYRGDFRTGKKHGKGVKLWPNTGDRYDGEFADDRKEGSGTYVWGPRSAWAGEKYTGSYLNDMRHGYGTYEWSSEDRYTGSWANDIATGPATPGMILRARAYSEARAAIARPGIKVCREMKVGIATLEWIKGSVVAVEEDGISVRIDEPGQLGHLIRGIPVSKGTLIKDDFPNWKPC